MLNRMAATFHPFLNPEFTPRFEMAVLPKDKHDSAYYATGRPAQRAFDD
ncbi:hypothetical protein [Burkholderia pyrrocinia]|nr:hypothetical protein [Burkholderia pyrrocinia]